MGLAQLLQGRRAGVQGAGLVCQLRFERSGPAAGLLQILLQAACGCLLMGTAF